MKTITLRKLALTIIVVIMSLNMVACNSNSGYQLTKTCNGCGSQNAFEVAQCMSNAGDNFEAAKNCVSH